MYSSLCHINLANKSFEGKNTILYVSVHKIIIDKQVQGLHTVSPLGMCSHTSNQKHTGRLLD